jgi:hypothetical protein
MDTVKETNETPVYTLSLKGEGMSLERNVAKDVALEIINVALGGAEASRRSRGGGSNGPGNPGSAGPDSDERVAPGEFIEAVTASSNPQKILAFGVYLADHRGEESFTRDDIKGMFRSAHEPLPGNFGRDFRNALSSNWIASEDGSSDRYFVTKTGRNVMNGGFADGAARRPRRRAGRASSGGDQG